ncbi:DJ-1/PfpI family protein [Mycobacterium xenopi 3993]|nr:DJ-1/PfpI family protein [Mycobacterium xenopi 3993]
MAGKLGLPVPDEQPVDDKMPASPALSQLNTATDSIETRKIAVLAANGVDVRGTDRLLRAMRQRGAIPEVLAPVGGGSLTGGSGGELAVDRAINTMASVLYDAVIVPCGPDSVAALSDDGYAVNFVTEAYKHLKPVGAFGAGIELLRKAGLPSSSLMDPTWCRRWAWCRRPRPKTACRRSSSPPSPRRWPSTGLGIAIPPRSPRDHGEVPRRRRGAVAVGIGAAPSAGVSPCWCHGRRPDRATRTARSGVADRLVRRGGTHLQGARNTGSTARHHRAGLEDAGNGIPPSGWDVLLASAGSGPLTRMALRPATSWAASMSSLMPLRYKQRYWWIRAEMKSKTEHPGVSLDSIRKHIDHGGIEFTVEQACGTGRFKPLAILSVDRWLADDQAPNVAFDPTIHSPRDVTPAPGWLTDLRRRAYDRSREGRRG